MQQVFESWMLHANRRPKILIADDQPSNIKMLHEIFCERCDVYMATSGVRAVQLCQEQLPDLVLLDVVMDGIDGHEVCRLLKADPVTRDIPIVFVTANSQEADEVIALQLGAVDFITKPINAMIVRARVSTHLTLKLQGDLLRASALLDGLTGIANRRKFDEDMIKGWRQCLREQMPFAMIMLDVDRFKHYNDSYGHQAGDSCLKQVAKCISETLRRPYDVVARYGGEEFACLLPNTDLVGAVALAEKIRLAVQQLALEHAHSDASQVVTVSLGVASVVPTADLDAAILIEAADKHLYHAKRSGRAMTSSDLLR